MRISNKKTFSSLGAEIAWQSVSPEKMHELSRAHSSAESRTHGILFPTMPDSCLNVTYADASFFSRLNEKFLVSEQLPDAPSLTFVSESSQRSDDEIAQGYVTSDRRDALVVGEGFGLFKSAISGFASYQCLDENLVPAHAAALSINGVGALILGGSCAGKTTTSLLLTGLAQARKLPFQLLADDWVVVQQANGRLIAKSFDPSISLQTQDMLLASDTHFEIPEPLKERMASGAKISVKPGDIFGKSVGVDEIVVDLVIVLHPYPGPEIYQAINSTTFASAAVDSAYHFPYTNADVVDAHIAFWRAAFEQIRVVSFATRPNELGTVKPVHSLLELFAPDSR
jgi:hypothetical protein